MCVGLKFNAKKEKIIIFRTPIKNMRDKMPKKGTHKVGPFYAKNKKKKK
jgi:hypothetical protein